MPVAVGDVGPRVNNVGIAVLVGTLVLATVVGVLLRRRDGRLRSGGASGGWALAGPPPSDAERVLLLQLSSPVCTPCRQTAAVLTDLTARRPGLVHREVDVAERPDVARELNVMRTPTLVAFDREGRELLRVSGVPRVAELEAELAPELARP
jgi:thiol-disulfide isomerase/thioredoxin